nr:MAG TPA: hypothetical protein [Caudoviricetes sp.]
MPGFLFRANLITNVKIILTDFRASPGIEPRRKPLSRKLTPKQKLYGKRPIIKLESPYLASLNTIPF